MMLDICVHYSMRKMVAISPLCVYVFDKQSGKVVRLYVPATSRYMNFTCRTCGVYTIDMMEGVITG